VEEPRSVSLIEIIASTKLIGHNEFSQSVKGSNRFWKKNELEFPRLFLLWQVLSNSGCTSAHIERYFNITGLVCYKRRLYMTCNKPSCRWNI